MQVLKTIGREGLGLFVADARFTLALIGWIAISGVAVVSLDLKPGICAVVLFAGFAVILLESLVHVASSAHGRSAE